jgi:hypothetical protein
MRLIQKPLSTKNTYTEAEPYGRKRVPWKMATTSASRNRNAPGPMPKVASCSLTTARYAMQATEIAADSER